MAGVSVTPDNVLSYAFKIVNTVWKGLSLSPLELGDSLILVFSGIVMLIAFAVMSAQLFMTIVKSYTLLAIAPLIFSLGGLQNTRQMAYNPFFAIIKVGLELLLIKLFMGLTLTKIQAFASSVNDDNSSLIAMMTIAIVIASVVHMIPGMVESVMSGSLGQNSTSGIGTAAMVSGGALGAAKSATGMGLAVKAASSLAKEQRAAGDTTASTFKNLRSAFADDIKRSMAGENIGNGTMGARMAFKHSTDASLAAQTKAMKENGSAPNNNMKATANEEAAFASQQKENDGK